MEIEKFREITLEKLSKKKGHKGKKIPICNK